MGTKVGPVAEEGVVISNPHPIHEDLPIGVLRPAPLPVPPFVPPYFPPTGYWRSGTSLSMRIVDMDTEKFIGLVKNQIIGKLPGIQNQFSEVVSSYLSSINQQAKFKSVYLMPGRIGRSEGISDLLESFSPPITLPVRIGDYDGDADYASIPESSDSDCSLLLEISEINV